MAARTLRGYESAQLGSEGFVHKVSTENTGRVYGEQEPFIKAKMKSAQLCCCTQDRKPARAATG